MSGRLRPVAWILGLAVLAGACGRRDDGESRARHPSEGARPSGRETGEAETGGVSMGFTSTPDPMTAGDNLIEMTVRQADGSPVTDGTVTAVFSMPAMPSMNMPAMRSDATLAHVGDGRYRGVGQLSMGGTWNVVVTVTRAGERLATKKFSIVAK